MLNSILEMQPSLKEIELRKIVSLYSGLLMIGLAFWVDIRSQRKSDYAFWI